MSDGVRGFGGDGMINDGDGRVTAPEMVAKLAADLGVEPAVIEEECQLYAWHLTELLACHRRFDLMKGADYGDTYRRAVAQMILTDGRAHVPDR